MSCSLLLTSSKIFILVLYRMISSSSMNKYRTIIRRLETMKVSYGPVDFVDRHGIQWQSQWKAILNSKEFERELVLLFRRLYTLYRDDLIDVRQQCKKFENNAMLGSNYRIENIGTWIWCKDIYISFALSFHPSCSGVNGQYWIVIHKPLNNFILELWKDLHYITQ